LKRSAALNEIKLAGYDGDAQRMALLAARYDIGRAAARRAFLAGAKAKNLGEPRPETGKDK
jgi:hypothetical protein